MPFLNLFLIFFHCCCIMRHLSINKTYYSILQSQNKKLLLKTSIQTIIIAIKENITASINAQRHGTFQ